MSRLVNRVTTVVILLAAGSLGADESMLALEDFESGLHRWQLDNPEQIAVVIEPGTDNRVIQLTPKRREFVHAILAESLDWRDLAFEGRFQFPEDGDGYLGFIYNYQQTDQRMDFGCLYVKSNGNYIRVSPHYDGNPSWRLYEELRHDLVGDQQIQTGRWHQFRLEVRAHIATLFIDDMESPLVRFDLFPSRSGGIGLEARPGGGAPVWVDDLMVSALPAAATSTRADDPAGSDWEILGPFDPEPAATLDLPELPEVGWQPMAADRRGALITGRLTQYRSGEQNIVYLKHRFHIEDGEVDGPTWLAVSSANRLDVWLNGYFRGTVAEERFIWSDFLSNADRPGARLPLLPQAGTNEIIIRVHGRRFAGGGMFVALDRPE